jgi:hypothetical protein
MPSMLVLKAVVWHHASAAVRRFDEREKPPDGGQTQQAEIQITRK